MAPDIRTVIGNVDRHITDDLDLIVVGVFLQCIPLLHENELDKAVKLDLVGKAGSCLLDRLGIAHGEGGLPGIPGCALVLILERHKEGIIRQPERICLLEAGVAAQGLFLEALEGTSQDGDIRAVEQLIVDLVRLALPELGGVVLMVKESQLLKCRKVDEIGVSRVNREALIGRIAVAGRREGKDLPVCRFAHVQKIHKVICRSSHPADAAAGG